MTSQTKQAGLSLIEVSMFLVLIGLMLGVTFSFLRTIDTASVVEKSEGNLRILNARLSDYIHLHNTIPCPAEGRSGEGERDSTTGICKKDNGYVPWGDLGLSSMPVDGEGIRFFYAVNNFVTQTHGIGRAGAYDLCADLAIQAQLTHQASNSMASYRENLGDRENIYNYEVAYVLASGGHADIDGDGRTLDIFSDPENGQAAFTATNLVKYKVNLNSEVEVPISGFGINSDQNMCLTPLEEGGEAVDGSGLQTQTADDYYKVRSLVSLIGNLNCPAVLAGINSMENEARIAGLQSDAANWMNILYVKREAIDEENKKMEVAQLAMTAANLVLGLVAGILDTVSEMIKANPGTLVSASGEGVAGTMAVIGSAFKKSMGFGSVKNLDGDMTKGDWDDMAEAFDGDTGEALADGMSAFAKFASNDKLDSLSGMLSGVLGTAGAAAATTGQTVSTVHTNIESIEDTSDTACSDASEYLIQNYDMEGEGLCSGW
jgi:hypothetical protein